MLVRGHPPHHAPCLARGFVARGGPDLLTHKEPMATLTELHRRLSQNDNRYALHFAGHARLTRRVDLMAQMLADARSILADVKSLKTGPDRQAITQAAERQIQLYTNEHAAIGQIQTQLGPLAKEASVLGTRANTVFHRYARHFSGQNRSTRDGTLMQEMVRDLEAIHADMQAILADQQIDGLRADMEVVEGRLDQFRAESTHIAAAQTEVSPPDQAGALAGVANNLFAQYRVHFAGLPRVSRRPELLVRLVDGLEAVKERMQALDAQGLRDEHNVNNIGIVEGRLQMWTQELAAIRKERQASSLGSMVADLETAANAELESYAQHFAGQNRRTRDLGKLTEIIDRLDEVERQMSRLDQVQENADNQLHLAVVRDALALYQNEFDEIAKVQGKA